MRPEALLDCSGTGGSSTDEPLMAQRLAPLRADPVQRETRVTSPSVDASCHRRLRTLWSASSPDHHRRYCRCPAACADTPSLTSDAPNHK